MTDMVSTMIKLLLYLLPFILFALLNMCGNLKKRYRSRQFLMPVLALIYCVLLLAFLPKISQALAAFIAMLPELLTRFAQWLSQVLDGRLSGLGDVIRSLAGMLERALEGANMTLVVFFVSNALFMLAHIILKRILVSIMKAMFKNGGAFFELAAGLFYEKDEQLDEWCVKNNFGQGRTFLKTVYITVMIVSAAAVMISGWMYREELLSGLYYPAFGVIVIGEIFFFLDGLTKQELHDMLYGEDDSAVTAGDYSLMRPVLRRLFGDKLSSENTAVSAGALNMRTNDELLRRLEDSDDVRAEGYGRFMRRKHREGMKLDHNYLASGLELLCGRSILFNNPFYYDLIPYIFYPMNRAILRHQKVLIVLGRHGIEDDLEQWCREGLTAVTNVPSMWNIGVLGDSRIELDVGLLTRSSVHDLKMHEANADFLSQVGFVVIIEPSRLVTTAQIGLNSIVRRCRGENGEPVFCSLDKNCDGLVDSLSHILMTNLTEVSATNHHEGVSSYMCWETDSEHLQHRMLPNLSRYLGVGTELSFAALKNQIPRTDWYGGEAFPVVDIHWIAKQYYYDLLHYASLPESQDTLDEMFRVSANLWNAKAEKRHYMTVEDESFNMFEIKRDFATRATEQGFINVVSQDYLLRDYMAENDGIFNSDPKAIPYIAADYAHTRRNVILRLCLRMSAGLVSEADVRQELMLVDADTEDLRESLWSEICLCCSVPENGQGPELIRIKRRFSLERECMEDMYYITDAELISSLLGDLQSAGYIAEDEKGNRLYLGSELRGHVFQKYLPGQLFTFGGKYYEMQRVTADGHVLVRRAADHITGRPSYRQVRKYSVMNAVDSGTMGDKMEIGGMNITMQYADIEVETPAYWRMERYNDFKTGNCVTVNGVPKRRYRNKQILRIELDKSATPEICRTLTLLLNEVFRTLFAENHAFIAAVTPENAATPLTYSLDCELGVSPERNMIYIIEDSQLDLGLLVAVRRNLDRIFAIICDYLDWHISTLEESLHPHEEPVPPDFTVDSDDEDEPKTRLGRLIKKIKRFFKRLFTRIGNLFRKLAGKPPKPLDGAAKEPAGEVVTAETEILRDDQPVPGAPAEPESMTEPELEHELGPGPESEPELELEPEPESEPELEPESEPEPELEPESESEPESEPEPEIEPESEPEPETEPESETDSEPRPLMSVGADPRLYAEYDALASSGEPVELEEEPVGFEPVRLARPTAMSGRKPYYERYYLLYGGESVPAHLDVEGTHEFLVGLGFAGNELEQARKGKSAAELIEKTFIPGKAGSHYCDFCGTELFGTEYEVLADGRESCIACGKTALRTAEEFVQLYAEVRKNMEVFYGAKITVPVRVEMVNAKKLHKRLGKTFVPTGNSDGRVLGVAIKNRKGYSILLENGSPRMQSAMTMAHELTHIWQYLNWDRRTILANYGKAQELEVYEGMAKWSEIQYAYLINEPASAKREEIITRMRDDEYGRGFRKYMAKYPLTEKTYLEKQTPFMDKERPL